MNDFHVWQIPWSGQRKVSLSILFFKLLSLTLRSDETKADIISKIHGRDMEPRHQEHCSKRASGTGDWVLNHETYVEWKDRAGSLLWLSGHGISR